MFDDVTNGTENCKANLRNFNNKLDEGEQIIADTNSNIRTDEILDNIELAQNNINTIHDSITTINDNISSLKSDIATSKSIRQQEIAAARKKTDEIEEYVDLD